MADAAVRSLALGLDAGGTYTDAAILDLAGGQVVGWAKAPTRHDDLTHGLAAVLAQLDPQLLAAVTVVSLSTTLATNALVEDRGARVGLLLMPPSPNAAAAVRWAPRRLLPGRLTIDGRELEPVDHAAVRAVVAELLAEGVESFAVSGYAGVANPVHELAVGALVAEISGRPVICGHQLTGRLDFVRRAHTAALNARLMPIIGRLFDAATEVLASVGVQAPLYIVRGDGSLLAVDAARQRPIETILSGPAASVVGARYLTGLDDLAVIDIGGTTTDVALVEGGQTAVGDEGAVVGSWRTSVTAAEIMTSGLGGDSVVALLDGGARLAIGPGRAEPISATAAAWPTVNAELADIAALAGEAVIAPAHLEWFRRVGPSPAGRLEPREERLLAALTDGPRSRRQLRAELAAPSLDLLPTARLEALGVIRRCAFTPTDALHVLGRDVRHDAGAARLVADLLGRFVRRSAETFARWVEAAVHRRIALTVVRRELAATLGDPGEAPSDPLLAALLGELVEARATPRAAWSLQFTVRRPLVAIGAPAHVLAPPAGALLGAELIVPPQAQVANAVGAATGQVLIREAVRIQPTSRGTFVMVSALGHGEFDDLEAATAAAGGLLDTALRASAQIHGADSREVRLESTERLGQTSDGGLQLVELVVRGTLVGAPITA